MDSSLAIINRKVSAKQNTENCLKSNNESMLLVLKRQLQIAYLVFSANDFEKRAD